MKDQTSRKEKVLVVDDDSALCELVSQVSRLEDYEPCNRTGNKVASWSIC